MSEEEVRFIKCEECQKEFTVLEGSFWGVTCKNLCDSCLIQPERSKREEPEKACGTLNLAEMQ